MRSEFVTVAPILHDADYLHLERLSAKAAVPLDSDSGNPADRAGSRSADIYAPFFNLAGEGKSLSARTLTLVADSLRTESGVVPTQGATRVGMRRGIILDSGLLEYRYDLEFPDELPHHLRSPAWQMLADHVQGWASLSASARSTVASLLNKLSLYDATLRLLPEPASDDALRDEDVCALELRRLMAGSKVDGATDATVRGLERVARAGPPPAVLSSAILLVVYHGRFTRDAGRLATWADVTQTLTVDFENGSPWERLTRSIVLRGASFVPMVQRDVTTVWALLDRAVAITEDLREEKSVPEPLLLENLYALTETRSNVAKLCGDGERACEIGRGLVTLDPFDQASHLKLGDLLLDNGDVEGALRAYQAAAGLGGTLTALALFCAARAHERLENMEAALTLYGRSVAADPGAVASLLGIRRVSRLLGRPVPASAEWVEASLAYLRKCVVGWRRNTSSHDGRGVRSPVAAGTDRGDS